MNWWKIAQVPVVPAKTAQSQVDPKQYFAQLRRILDAADASLPPEAQDAITMFVAHPPQSRDKGEEMRLPIMRQETLEDACSAKPSPQGSVVAKQLAMAFAPVKAQLKQMFGNALPLVRYQRAVPQGSPPRNVLSWTLNPKFAEYLAGIRPIQRITQQDINKAMQEIQTQGWTQLGSHVYRVDPQYPDHGAINLYEAADDYGGESYVTGYGDRGKNVQQVMQEIMQDIRQQREEEYREMEELRKQSILSATVPLDKIVWATDRANQMEFIVRQ